MVAAHEMGDLDGALGFHERVLQVDPQNEKSVDEVIVLLENKGDYKAAVERLKEKATAASAAKNTGRMLAAFNRLGHLYKEKLGRIGHAIDAHEAAQTLEPDNKERNEILAQLYASNPSLYLDKAVAAQLTMLNVNPYREESYKLLRRLYTEAKRADPAWCMCQALYVLKLAEPDEERFFKRMRSEDPAYAQEIITEDEWVSTLLHPDAEPLLTSIFALIEPAVIATRGESYEALGYDPRYAIDPAQHPYPMSQTLFYAAGVMGMDCPPTFENPNDPGGLAFLHVYTPSVVLGHAALTADIPPQAAAFIAGRHLAYYRPGMYLRHLVPSGTGLKSWLFAAIRMNAPNFPVASDIEGPIKEAQAALERHLQPQVRDHLSRIVSKLIQGGRSLDLKKWVAGVDATADRIGFVLSHDLETAVEIVRASDEGSSSMPQQQRLKELVLFAIGEPYFALRKRLRITIDG
jgi:tetratricopeptide (TPR) repeat protein